MEATDVLAVHAGYAKHRRQLLEAGIKLYEMKASATPVEQLAKHRPVSTPSSNLHAKTFAVDGKRVYVGSFNFDPRSALLNTEMGFLSESKRSASMIREMFDNRVVGIAYRPYLTSDGKVEWEGVFDDGTRVIHTSEPNSI